MAGEGLFHESRQQALGDMVGLMLHQAVAEGAVAMAQMTREGTPEHDKWTEVARKAVPLAGEFLEEVKQRHPDIATSVGEVPVEVPTEPSISPEVKAKKQKRLAKIEAEAARLREELGE